MTWNDLNDDLDFVENQLRVYGPKGISDLGVIPTLIKVARRVAALWQKCPDCGGGGEIAVNGDGAIISPGYPCSRCGGSGLLARADTLGENAVTLTVFEGDTRTFISLDELKRYLFGKE